MNNDTRPIEPSSRRRECTEAAARYVITLPLTITRDELSYNRRGEPQTPTAYTYTNTTVRRDSATVLGAEISPAEFTALIIGATEMARDDVGGIAALTERGRTVCAESDMSDVCGVLVSKERVGQNWIVILVAARSVDAVWLEIGATHDQWCCHGPCTYEEETVHGARFAEPSSDEYQEMCAVARDAGARIVTVMKVTLSV